MGNFRIVIEAVGGHGCQREVKDGGVVAERCGSPTCPDCLARYFVEELKRAGTNVTEARLEHWPTVEGFYKADTVVDDLLTRERFGSFGLAQGENNVLGLARRRQHAQPNPQT